MLEWLRWFHMSCAAISITGFIVRCYWSFFFPHLLQHRAIKILPHCIDTLLLTSGVCMLAIYNWQPLTQAWLIAKLCALLFYIVCGSIALKRAKSPVTRAIALGFSLMGVGYLVSVALTRSPMGFFQ